MEDDSNEDQIIDNIIQVFSSSLNSDLFFSKDIVNEKLNLVKTLMVNPPLHYHHLFYSDLPILLLIPEVGSDGRRTDL
jgi:hypothetical protein